MECMGEGEGLAAGKAAGAGRLCPVGREGTATPGIEEKPTPIVSHICENVVNPVEVQGEGIAW